MAFGERERAESWGNADPIIKGREGEERCVTKKAILIRTREDVNVKPFG